MSPCDEAIQGPRAVAPGLLRCARNDGALDATIIGHRQKKRGMERRPSSGASRHLLPQAGGGAGPIIVAAGIHKRFTSLVVLDGVNFSMRPDEAVGIVGPNGAGKTTLLSVLVGAHAPSEGTISFKGEDVTRLPTPERCRRGLVRTHQIPRPFTGMTVFENLYVAAANGGQFAREEAYDRCIDSLRLCGMLPLA